MKHKTKIITLILALLLIAGQVALSPALRSYLMSTFIGDVYIYCFRSEKTFDKDHVITHLASSDKKIIVNAKDRCVCRSIRVTGYWEKKNTRILMNLVKPGQTILEVGANYGYYTLNFAKQLKGKGKIISYEANPAVFKYLEQSVKLNRDEELIRLMPFAASDKKSETFLVYDLANIGGGQIVTPGSPEFDQCKASQYCLPVKSTLIDEDLKDIPHIDLIKIDAEGSEIRALKGAENLIDRSPDLIIVMEWAPEALKKFGDVKGFVKFLTDKGFRFWYIDQADGQVYTIKPEDLPNHPFLELVLCRQNLLF